MPDDADDLAQVKKRLVRMGTTTGDLYTVDPDAIHKRLLQRYVPGFDPVLSHFTIRRTDATTRKNSRCFIKRSPASRHVVFNRPHCSTYVFDREGRVALFVKHGESIEPMVADLKRLLS